VIVGADSQTGSAPTDELGSVSTPPLCADRRERGACSRLVSTLTVSALSRLGLALADLGLPSLLNKATQFA
jgi:hypothetical protein